MSYDRSSNTCFISVLCYVQLKPGQPSQYSDQTTGWKVRAQTRGRYILWPTQPPIHLVPGSFPGDLGGRSVMLTTYLHLALRSRISGGISLFLLCNCMAWTATTLPLLFTTVVLGLHCQCPADKDQVIGQWLEAVSCCNSLAGPVKSESLAGVVVCLETRHTAVAADGKMVNIPSTFGVFCVPGQILYMGLTSRRCRALRDSPLDTSSDVAGNRK